MKKLSVGIIGLGNRGYGLLKDAILRMPSVKVTAVCDVYEDRCEEAARLTEELCGHTPAWTTDYRELLARKDVEAVVVSCAWESHIPGGGNAGRDCGRNGSGRRLQYQAVLGSGGGL